MFLVKTKVQMSPIHGLGAFAAESISAGTVVWRFMPGFDQVLPASVLSALPASVQDHVRHYCYSGDFFLLTVDNDRFVNHSEQPTMRFAVAQMEGIALRDIAVDEELTEDYRASGWRGDQGLLK